jgi:hypothetical protein
MKVYKQDSMCNIWGFHSGDCEECCRFLQEPHGVSSQKMAFYRIVFDEP